MTTTWAIIATTGQIVGAFSTRARAEQTLALLGPDLYTMVQCDEQTGVRVLYTWRCHAYVGGDEVEVNPPFLLIDRTRLVHHSTPDTDVERVEIDGQVSELATIVEGRPVHHVLAYAADAARAEHLARERATSLAAVPCDTPRG